MTDLEKAESYNGKLCDADGGPFYEDLIFVLDVRELKLTRTTRQYYTIDFVFDNEITRLVTWNMRLDELERFLKIIA